MTQRLFWRATLVSLLLVCAASAQNAAALKPVPDFVTKHAPLVWLHSLDPFRPSDLLTHVRHTTPTIDQVSVPNLPSLTLDNLALLNGLNGTVALTSKDDVTTLPSWLMGDVPDETGRTANATSCVVILVDKGQDEVDAFYFYFYSYDRGANLTQVVEPLNHLVEDTQHGVPFGDHVGDWQVSPPILAFIL
ncbi:hypothetical protein E4U31_000101 [Claviceps sp. LM219 group G6]|nr:hypothetical protein E4U31_000101 [Claviceps sp. LM219 group G6]